MKNFIKNRSKSSKLRRSKYLNEPETVIQIGNTAIKKAQKQNKKLGIPNVFGLNGKTVYQLPNGTITTKNPWKD